MMRAGLFKLLRNGKLIAATEGEFKVNLGRPKANAVMNGYGEVQGFEFEGQAPSIEGEIYVKKSIDLDEIISPSEEGDTIAIQFQDKRTFTLEGSQFTGDGQFTTKGRLPVSWQGMSATFS